MRAAPFILALAACSTGSGGGDAGDLVDAGDDAGPVDAATDASPSEVRVLVTSAGAPRAGARVAIHLPDGTSLGPSKATAADGRASFPVPAAVVLSVGVVDTDVGGMPQSYKLFTVAGAAPGDDLHLETEPPPAPGNPPADGTMTVSAARLAGGTYDYQLGYGCVAEPTVVAPATDPFSFPAVEGKPGCYDADGKLAFLVTARTSGGTVVAHAADLGRPFVAGGTASVPASAWAAASDVGISFSGFPINTVGAGAVFSEWYRGRRLARTAAQIIPIGGTGSVAFRATRSAADAQEYSMEAALPPDGDFGGALLHVEAAAPPVAVRAGGFAGLPVIAGINVVIPPEPRPRIGAQWAFASAPAGDCTSVRVSWSRDGVAYQWRAVAPPDAMGVQVPILPDDMDAWKPTAGAFSYQLVALFDFAGPAGYDALRAAGLNTPGLELEPTAHTSLRGQAGIQRVSYRIAP